MKIDSLLIYENISQCATLSGVAKKNGRFPVIEDLDVIENASVVVSTEDQRIEWVGEARQLPDIYSSVVNRYPCEGELWIPELVECHTHLIYSGQRYNDYALRASGRTYQEIAAAGGGILSTIIPTRAAPMADLIESAVAHLDRFQKWGVGTIEAKSGYGLTLESELKILETIQALSERTTVMLVPTFMPAHAIPPEYKGRADDYVKDIVDTWIPEVARRKLARFFDVFVEGGFFDARQSRILCEAAKASGLGLKLHTDQFTDIGGTDVALELGAASCDHLDFVSEKNIRALGEKETVAVLLPGASLYMGTRYPPARALIDAGARVAISTDFNPGTCPTRNLPLMTTLACSQMKMTVAEAIAGITYNAAAALGLESKIGSIEKGKAFRVCQLNIDSVEAIPYLFGELS